MFSLLLIFIIGGVYAEDISCDADSEIQVSEYQAEISSDDIVSSNYLTDSEVSHTSQVDDGINEGGSDDTEEISSTINVDEMSYDYSVSSDLEDKEALSPALEEVGNSKVMSIGYSVASASDLEENNQVEIPTVDVGNSKFISMDYTVSSSLEDGGVVIPSVSLGNYEFMTVDCSDSINQCPTNEINSIDNSDELCISISAQNCMIQEGLNNFDLYECIVDVSSDVEASESSRLGRIVITSEKLNFESIEDVFILTEEGMLKLDCKISEPVIKGIFDAVRCISHGEVYPGIISGCMQNSDIKEIYCAFETEGLKFINFVDGFDNSIGLNVLHKTDSYSQNPGCTIAKELLQYYPPANKGNIIVMEDDSNLLGSYDEDEECLGISYADSDGIDLCNPLWFDFILKQSDGSLMSIYMRYNEDNLFIIGYNWTQTYNLMSTLYNSTLSSGMSKSAYPDRIDKAIDTDQWYDQELSNYATSESINAVQSQDLSSINVLSSLEDINNEDLMKSIATDIDNAKDNTKTNICAKNCTKCKSCKCVNFNCSKCNLKCNCSNCNCSKCNCSKCNCSHHGRKHHSHGHHEHGYRKYIRYEYIGDVVNKIGDSYGMLADNSTDENSTDNVTATTKGPFNIPKPVEPTNFNTLIISIAGVLVLGVLFGISHRRQQN